MSDPALSGHRDTIPDMESSDTAWPPTVWWIPGDTEWEPPEIFEPHHNRPPIPLEGEGLLVAPPSDAEVGDEGSEEAAPGHEARMLVTWARESLRSGQRYYRLARLVAWTDWAIDKAEEWSPTERDLKNRLAAWWVSGQQAVEAYFHFQVWREKVTGEDVDGLLRQLRNSLVHLDEAWLDDYSAHTIGDDVGKPIKAWAIYRLPGGELPLTFHPGCVDSLFALIPLRDVFSAANVHLSWPSEEGDWL
jgi:hypothetical protein